MVPPMKSLIRPLSLSTRDAGRRDFLAWMLAVPALAGCTVTARDDASEPASGSADLPAEAMAGSRDSSAEGEVAQAEEDWTVCRATSRDAEGPYFEPGSPLRTQQIAAPTEPGVRLLVEGKLVGPDCKTPLRGYAIDLWQASSTGTYFDSGNTGYRLRGKILTDGLGRYRFETVLPGRYGDSEGIRPAHIHAKILTPHGNPLLTTQLYFAGDPYLGQADYCTRQRTCNSGDAKRALKLVDAVVSGKAGKRAAFDAILART